MNTTASLNSKNAFVLFGSTGDLAVNKILPGLCELFRDNHFPFTTVIACGRRVWTDEEYHSFIRPSLLALYPADTVDAFLQKITYLRGELDSEDLYTTLQKIGVGQEALYHLAIHPHWYATVIEKLGRRRLSGKLLIEKPFGTNASSAKALEDLIAQYFSPEHIFRIDHYLAKEGLQRIAGYELPVGLRHIVCRILENTDVHNRGIFYDSVGTLRDVVQNHLLSMLSVSLLHSAHGELPAPQARARLSEHLVLIEEGLVRGQYEGYQEEQGVASDSKTETYVRVSARFQDPRFEKFTITLEAGKALQERQADITLISVDGSQEVWSITGWYTRQEYAVLMEAAHQGTQNLFMSKEEVAAAWKFVDAVAERLRSTPLHTYLKGSPPDEIGK